MRRSLVAILALAATAVVAPAAAHAAPLRAGAAAVDASWHVGASAGQYASDGSFVHPTEGNFDPTAHSTRRQSSYGIQSRLQIRALVVEGPGPNGKRFAIVKNDLYIPQDLVYRRAGQLLRERGVGIGPENLSMAVTHNHSSPFYSSTSWGVWTFQDVFDFRFFNYYAEKMADAVEQAAKRLVPVKVGAAVTQFDKTHRHSFGPAIADPEGTPAGYPNSDADHDLTVIRFDDISDPRRPRPLANLVNFALHPEFLDGNDLISADYLGPLEKMTDRATGAMTIWTQGAVGTAEPERSSYHSIHERLEFTHREYRQAEYGARLMSDAIVGVFRRIATGTPDPSWRQQDQERFVEFDSDFDKEEVGFEDRWFPGPLTRPYPGVSNCNVDQTLGDYDPQIPIIGLPDCKGVRSGLQDEFGVPTGGDLPLPIDPGLTTHDLDRLGIPVPTSYTPPAYGGLHEDINVHLQGARIGEIFFAMCSCELWADQARNTKTRTDRRADNEYLGYDWKRGGGAVSDGSVINPTGQEKIPPACEREDENATYGGEPEGYGDGTWRCPNPHNPSQWLTGLSDEKVERMHRQVVNPANGWNDPQNVLASEGEPADVRRIFGNFTHDDRCAPDVIPPSPPTAPKPENDRWNQPCDDGEVPPSVRYGYRLTVALGMVNDYNGYIASYREYRRGDHYRKALTGWGPHSSDYMSSRLANIGRVLRGADEGRLLPPENFQSKISADLAINEQRAREIGEGGTAAREAYEEGLPGDGGSPRAVDQPPDVERFDGAYFRWIGGSNYTDNPRVKVQRWVDRAWRDYAGQAGEIPVTVEYPGGEDVPAYETDSFEWKWTAHFEAFSSGIGITEGGRSTPAGTYRFVVEGNRRQGERGSAEVVPYQVVSEPFEVKPWSGIKVEDLRRETDGTVTFKVGPRSTRTLNNSQDEIGPIDYPDTYDYGANAPPHPRFIERNIRGVRDQNGFQWYCDECSFRPWLDEGDAQTATVSVVSPAGRVERVPAVRNGDRWRTTRALRSGESAIVGAGCVRDAYGNYNGSPSSAVGGPGAAANGGACPLSAPGGGGPGGGRPGGNRPGGSLPGGSGGGGSGTGVGNAIGETCTLPVGRLRGLTLGHFLLGRSRGRNRRAAAIFAQRRGSVDRFCLLDGRHVRIGYPSRSLLQRLSRRQRRRVRGRAVLVLSSSRHYRIRGVTNGTRVRTLKRRIRGLRSIQVGPNRWYLRRGAQARWAFKVRRGRVREIGLADRRLTGTRRATRRFLRSFH